MTNLYRVIDGAFPADLLRRAAAAWPSPDWPHWLRYDNALERKRACNDWRLMPPACAELLRRLLCLPVAELLPGLPPCTPDLSLHGGGMHDMGRGDHLDLHLDADRHPTTGMERRANAILFVDAWAPPWGGEFWLWRGLCGRPVKVWPAEGRLLLFRTDGESYHGVPEPVRCPRDCARTTLAAFWWGPPAGEPAHRPRAQFVATPGRRDSPAKAALRADRARPRDCQPAVTAAPPAAG